MLRINVEMLAAKLKLLERVSEMLEVRITTFFSNFVEYLLKFFKKGGGVVKSVLQVLRRDAAKTGCGW